MPRMGPSHSVCTAHKLNGGANKKGCMWTYDVNDSVWCDYRVERKHAIQSRGVNDAKGCMAADLRLTGLVVDDCRV